MNRPGSTFPPCSDPYRPPQHPVTDVAPGSQAAPGEPSAAPEAALVLFSGSGEILFWNGGAEQLLGWTAPEMVGAHLPGLLPAARERQPAAHPAGAGQPEVFLVHPCHRDGTLVPLRLDLYDLSGSGTTGARTLAALHSSAALSGSSGSVSSPDRTAWARFTESVIPQVSLSADGTIRAVNPALCVFSGHPAAELVGRPFHDFMLPSQLGEAAASWEQTTRGELPTKRVVRSLRRADGGYAQVRLSMFTVHDDHGQIESIEAALEDITRSLRDQQELRASEARWRSLALRSADVAFLATAAGELRFVTPSLKQHFGYCPEEVLGQDGFSFYHPDDLTLAHAGWERALSTPGNPANFRARVGHRNGNWRWIDVTATNWLDDPDIGAVAVNIIDVTDAVVAERRLATFTDADPLTGLLTSPALVRHLDTTLTGPAADRTCLILMNLDHFGQINAQHGHLTGDEVLVAVGDRLREQFPAATAARISGDHFALLIDDVADTAALGLLTDHLSAAVAEPVTVGSVTVQLSASIGAARRADRAERGQYQCAASRRSRTRAGPQSRTGPGPSRRRRHHRDDAPDRPDDPGAAHRPERGPDRAALPAHH